MRGKRQVWLKKIRKKQKNDYLSWIFLHGTRKKKKKKNKDVRLFERFCTYVEFDANRHQTNN